MSRCFPYPPPGYENVGISHEALIDSLKKKNEKAQKEREEKRLKRKREDKNHNEEKERKRTGHKKRHKGERSQDEKKGHKKRYKSEKSQDEKKGLEHCKRRKIETDPIEKSSLTEEHGQPVGSQDSFNSTRNGKVHHSLSDSIRDTDKFEGSIVRIRLPALRHKDLELPLCKQQQQSAVSESCNAFLQEKNGSSRVEKEAMNPASFNSTVNCKKQDLKLIKDKSPPPLFGASQHIDKNAPNELSSLEMKFRYLMENWVPPPPQSYCTDPYDQEWLCSSSTDQNLNFGPKKFIAMTHESSTCSAAYFLPEVEMYALPYTVPF